MYDGHLRSLHQATELSSSEGASLTILKGGIAVVVNYQSTGKALARHSRGMNVEYKDKIIRNSAKEDKNFPTGSDNERPLFTVDVTIAFMQLTHLRYGGSRHQMMFKMKETIERQLVEQTIRQRTRGAIACRFTTIMLNQVPNTNQKYRPNIDREGPEEQHRPQHPTHQTKNKETVDTGRKDQIIGQ
jgi:hypothetical protein